ncbi:MAG: asparaginase [Candidatus Kerfeldbacteria bacterium]|nr:asparaginase [Candidatus Kerfeldbacteria bacterium]
MSSALKRKRVRVVYLGGIPLSEPSTPQYINDMLSQFLELQLVADVEVRIIDNLAGADITWSMVGEAARDIAAHYDEFDGFVIMHGLDNVLYSANLVTFMFHRLTKPIVFTGMAHNESTTQTTDQVVYPIIGLQTNLLTAVQLATMNCRGVILAYGPHIVRAVRAVQHQGVIQPLDSIGEEEIARIQFGVQLLPHAPERLSDSVEFWPEFSETVRLVQFYPGFRLSESEAAQYSAIVAVGYEEQLVPTNLPLLETIPVVVLLSKPPIVPVPEGVIIMQGITLPALLTKTMVAIRRTTDPVKLARALRRNDHDELL